MMTWNEHEARRAIWRERVEQLSREAEAYRLLKQAKLKNPPKGFLHRLWRRLVPPAADHFLNAGLPEEPPRAGERSAKTKVRQVI